MSDVRRGRGAAITDTWNVPVWKACRSRNTAQNTNNGVFESITLLFRQCFAIRVDLAFPLNANVELRRRSSVESAL